MIDALRAMPSNGSFPRVVGAHLEGPFLSRRAARHPSARAPARSGSGAARTAARRRPGDRVHARARARRCWRTDQAPARARDRRLGRPHERDGGTGARRVRSRRVDRLAPLQRDAAVPLARSRHRRCRADAPRRVRADDRRRPSPRRGDRATRLGGRRRHAARSSATRPRVLPGSPARTSSATSRSTSPTACRCAATASLRARC